MPLRLGGLQSYLYGPLGHTRNWRVAFSSVLASVGGFDVVGGRRHAMANDRIVYAKTDGSGNYQLYRRILTAGSDTQLTNDAFHTGVPTIHPDGRHLIAQREIATHADQDTSGGLGSGWYFNLSLLDMATSTWYNLTNYSDGLTGGNPDGTTEGVLWPILTPHGSKVIWNEIHDRDTGQINLDYQNGILHEGTAPLGKCRMVVADLDLATHTISNKTTLLQGDEDGWWFEPQDTTSDGWVLFASDRIQPGYTHWPHRLALWELNLSDPAGTVRMVSRGGDTWEEFGTYTPNGDVVYMSSRGLWNALTDARPDLRTGLWHRNGSHRLIGAYNSLPNSQLLWTTTRWRGNFIYGTVHSHDADGDLTGIEVVRFTGGWFDEPLTTATASVNLTGTRAAGNNWTSPVNHRLRFTVTTLPNAGQAIQILVRYVNANNYGIIHITNTGALQYYEYIGGVLSAALASAAAVVAAGTTVDIVIHSTVIRLYTGGVYRTQYNTIDAAILAGTASNLAVLGTGAGVSDIVVWQYPDEFEEEEEEGTEGQPIGLLLLLTYASALAPEPPTLSALFAGSTTVTAALRATAYLVPSVVEGSTTVTATVHATAYLVPSVIEGSTVMTATLAGGGGGNTGQPIGLLLALTYA